jgi:hypothetical protein
VKILERDLHRVSPHFPIATNRRVESLYPLASSNAQRVLDFPSLLAFENLFGSARTFRQAQLVTKPGDCLPLVRRSVLRNVELSSCGHLLPISYMHSRCGSLQYRC